MKEHLHGGPPETADIESLKNEVSDLRQKVDQLTAENSELKQRVSTRNLSIEQANKCSENQLHCKTPFYYSSKIYHFDNTDY